MTKLTTMQPLTVFLALLAILALLGPAAIAVPASPTSTSASAAPTATAAGNATTSGNSTTTANSTATANTTDTSMSSGGLTTKFGDMAPACAKLLNETVQPLLSDPVCNGAALLNGQPATASELEGQVATLCSKACIAKANAALQAVSSAQDCSGNPLLNAAVLASFYEFNFNCLTVPDANPTQYCIVSQAKALESAKVAANATATQWPKDALCSACTAKQVALTASSPMMAQVASLSSRTNPAGNTTLLTEKCGQDWVAAAKGKQAEYVVTKSAAVSSSTTGGSAAGTTSTAGSGALARSWMGRWWRSSWREWCRSCRFCL
ncbi:hypothetical protein AMAG_04954 [Allomyces macrogynus ATCC 38327]|uniref:Uncharacterized protein n=1 Tax=Allomyces macrogynus (strain ATCC 38327) TaxID=578462 RepID=A0A0L0S6B7_ALLM3|nr:hypothetical protein AMAG_04954 [Allomyces macrogynus ATCC 38327]|eukprot:KNE58138.1 hypothetical protein AMAG_04954 [Allomyces macrogynus ATCC 38327]